MDVHPRIPVDDLGADAGFRGGVLRLQPELLDAFLRYYGNLWSHGVLDHATKEAARIRNARVVDCRWCRNVRFAVAREEGLTEEVVALIDDGHGDGALDDRTKAVLAYVDAFILDPGAVPGPVRATVLRHLDTPQVVELTLILGAFLGFAKLRMALGLEPAAMPTRVVPTPDVPAPA